MMPSHQTTTLATAFFALLKRDLLLAYRHRNELLNPLFFFVLVVMLFPLGTTPEKTLLMTMAPGVIWVAALLAALLSLEGIFRSDFEDGSLEQLLLSPHPTSLLVLTKILRLPDELKRLILFLSAILVQIGIFSTRWNVVIGGQLFSKSLRGLTNYKMELLGLEGLLIAIGLLVLPFIILTVMVKILPPWKDQKPAVS